jgi:hypothetical protein
MSGLGNKSFQGFGLPADAARRLDDLARQVGSLQKELAAQKAAAAATTAAALALPAAPSTVAQNLTNAIGKASSGQPTTIPSVTALPSSTSPLAYDGSVVFYNGRLYRYTAKTSTWALVSGEDLVPGTYGDSTDVAQIVVGPDGVISSITAVAIAGFGGSGTFSEIIFPGTSHSLIVTVDPATGAWTWTFPLNAGSNHQILQTDGSGNTSWTGAPTIAATNITGLPVGIPTGGTTGQSLTKNSNTAYDVVWATVSGGGASFPWMPTFTPPVAADFSWVNQGTATLDSSNPACIYLTAPAAGNNLRILKQALSGSKTLTVGYSALFLNLGYQGRGVVLYDSSLGKAVTFLLVSFSNLIGYYVSEFTSVSSGGSDIFSSLTTQPPCIAWMRIVYTSVSNVLFQFSMDGAHWKDLTTAFDFSAFFTPDSIGFCVNPNAGPYDTDMAVVSFTLA